jgi:DNA-binding NarL/FixJ family response regulator
MADELQTIHHDASTGETIIRPLTDEEIAAHKLIAAEAEMQRGEQEAKAADRESAIAKLSLLGLTENEISALLGGI